MMVIEVEEGRGSIGASIVVGGWAMVVLQAVRSDITRRIGRKVR